MSTEAATTSNVDSGVSSASSSGLKKYSLVKWLNNNQFDNQNSWQGRLTSVPHTNIIDYDADDLKSGMEINVVRNGEIWRAQVIIPKTASNTIDLPGSTSKKIRTKAMATIKLSDSDQMEAMAVEGSSDFDESIVAAVTAAADAEAAVAALAAIAMDSMSSNATTTHPSSSSQQQTTSESSESASSSLMVLNPVTPTVVNDASASQHSNNIQTTPQSPITLAPLTNTTPTTAATSSTATSTTSGSKEKEWQFLQTAINEAGLTDFYQTYNELQPVQQHVVAPSQQQQQQKQEPMEPQVLVIPSDTSIENILQMQCELLEQQKELKNIEHDTMEQLKLLHRNINRLTKKFDSFEAAVTHLSQNDAHSSANAAFNNNQLQATIKSTKSALTKLNSSIQQFRVNKISNNNSNNPTVTFTTLS